MAATSAAARRAAKQAQQEPGVDMRTDSRMSYTETPTSSDTISVGCKLPHGIHLDLRKVMEIPDQISGKPSLVPTGEPIQRFTLKGTTSLNAPEGVVLTQAPVSRIGGFAITHGVPREFFEEWMRMNKSHPAVRNHLIFAHEEPESVVAMGKEFAKVKTGLDPLDPTKTIVGGVKAREDKDPE